MVARRLLLTALAGLLLALAPPVSAELVATNVGPEGLDIWSVAGYPPPEVPQPHAQIGGSGYVIPGVPTSSWNYGCTATSAGMYFAYWDRNGYGNMYGDASLVAPLYLGDMDAGTNCPIIATPQHVADYWEAYEQAGPDPWEDAGRSDHVWSSCTADFMGTNQWKWDYDANGTRDSNVDGSTTFFSYTSLPNRLYDYMPPVGYGLPQTEACHGMRLFAESRGYTVVENYTQKVDARVAGGFSFADYQAEINAGNPVLIHVTGHTMLGVGYDAADTIYMHDTWGDYTASMVWGGAYSGMTMQAVTVMHLDPSQRTPEPATMILLMAGGPGMVALRRRRARRAA